MSFVQLINDRTERQKGGVTGLSRTSTQSPGSRCSGQPMKLHFALSLRISFRPLINIFPPKTHVMHISYCIKFKLWYLPTMEKWKSPKAISLKPQGILGKNIAKQVVSENRIDFIH